jgi:tetratricopeptide (TPR) repeat protein
MINLSKKNWASVVYGIIVLLFFAILYPFHLHYKEQFQLFLFSSDYFVQHLLKPGGVSDYLGIFLTQFNFYASFGAAILAFILVFFQHITWLMMKRTGVSRKFFLFSFLPSLLYFGLLCDENFMLGGLVALIITMLAAYIYTLLSSKAAQWICLLLLVPVLFYVSGGISLLMIVYVSLYEILIKRRRNFGVALLGAGLTLIFLTLFLTKNIYLQYSLDRAFVGVNYYRYPVNLPYEIGVIALLIGLLPFVFQRIKIDRQIVRRIVVIQYVVLLIGGSIYLFTRADMGKEEVMEYDFYTRMRMWDDIIEKADQKSPVNPLSVTCLNLALAQNDLLGEKMFHYNQNGVSGLIPGFKKDFTIPLIAGEVYYHLGFINTAQRYAFEAMEALPDYQKSVRVVKRLVETNLINGNYALALKYLKFLKKTFYYRKWAERVEIALQDETLIMNNEEWLKLRQYRNKEDFFFSEGEKDMMLGILYSQNQSNHLAFQYLMAYNLLKKDVQHFVQYFPMGEHFYKNRMPTHFQEALVYAWDVSKSKEIATIPYNIDRGISLRLKNYKKLYRSSGKNTDVLSRNYSDTFWYYVHFKN